MIAGRGQVWRDFLNDWAGASVDKGTIAHFSANFSSESFSWKTNHNRIRNPNIFQFQTLQKREKKGKSADTITEINSWNLTQEIYQISSSIQSDRVVAPSIFMTQSHCLTEKRNNNISFRNYLNVDTMTVNYPCIQSEMPERMRFPSDLRRLHIDTFQTVPKKQAEKHSTQSDPFARCLAAVSVQRYENVK